MEFNSSSSLLCFVHCEQMKVFHALNTTSIAMLLSPLETVSETYEISWITQALSDRNTASEMSLIRVVFLENLEK